MPRVTPISPGRSSTAIPCAGLGSRIAIAGLSIAEAARRAKLGRPRVANWIAEGHAPRRPLERLCGVLDCTVDDVAAPASDLEAAKLRLGLALRELERVVRDVDAAAGELAALHGQTLLRVELEVLALVYVLLNGKVPQ